MRNILHVIGYIGRGGDTSVVLEVMKSMDKEKYHFDFITHEGSTDMRVVQALRDQGSTVYMLKGDVRKLGLTRYYKEIRRVIRNAPVRYDAIHTHTSMQSGVALAAAKREGIQQRICHSHVSSIQREASKIKKIVAVPVFRFLISRFATVKVGCSKMAGDFLFGHDYRVVYNGVDIQKYQAVSEEDVAALRRELGINEHDVVIGHVARFANLKNQKFDVELAKALSDRKDLKFVLVGRGDNFDQIKQQTAVLGDQIILTGQRNDVAVLMKACDCVILPSLPGEGFPVTIMEAQAAGCTCIISEHVTTEVEIGLNLVKQIPLNRIDEWEMALRQIHHNPDFNQRNEIAQAVEEKGFGKQAFIQNWLTCYK